MRAARMFTRSLIHGDQLAKVVRVQVELYGSLGATGKGHGSDKAVLLGLTGHEPDTVDVDGVPLILDDIRSHGVVALDGTHTIAFDERRDLTFHRQKVPPFHANGMRIAAFDSEGQEDSARTYYSVGGGFVVSDEVAADGSKLKTIAPDTTVLSLP